MCGKGGVYRVGCVYARVCQSKAHPLSLTHLKSQDTAHALKHAHTAAAHGEPLVSPSTRSACALSYLHAISLTSASSRFGPTLACPDAQERDADRSAQEQLQEKVLMLRTDLEKERQQRVAVQMVSLRLYLADD